MSKLTKYFFLLLTVTHHAVNAQSWSSTLHGLPKDFTIDNSFQKLSRTNYITELKSLQISLINSGYLAAGIDSVTIIDSIKKIDIYLFTGSPYSYSKLRFDNKYEEALSSSGFRDRLFSNKPFNPLQLSKLFEKVLSYYENNGYPFTSIKLDSTQIIDNEISSKLTINEGPLIRIDSIHIKGGVHNSNKVVYNIIQVTPNDLYRQNIIDQIDTRIKESPFLVAVKPTEYDFTNNKCNIYVYLKNKPASNFNGIIGILPDDNGKINITGDVKIKLINALHQGESIEINWRKIQNLTQNLKTAFTYPFLFNTSFGIDTKFSLYKRDTTFINLEGKLGVQYIFNSNNSLAVFYQNKSSNLISTKQFEFATTLPEFADISNNAYGIEVKSSKLDYKYNPTKGFLSHLTASAGTKVIRKNNNLNPIIYENTNLKTVQFSIQSKLDFYIPIKKRSTVKLGSNTGFIFNENIFTNELFRIGGNRILRGFDEESIYTSSYATATLEYRFLLEENSNLFAFIDGAWYENSVEGNFITDTPIGTGVGINFSTKPGIFSISYALGSQMGNPFLFRSAKIHFGFVSIF